MNKKDLFRIILKFAGLYWIVINMYNQLPFLFSLVFNRSDYTFLPYLIGYFLVCIAIFIILVLYTDKLIDWIKLDKGFDEDQIEFSNFNIENILKLALIIVGCMLIINNISIVIIQAYYFIKINVTTNQSDSFGYTSQSGYQFTISFFNLFIGYILITNYPALSKFILKITQKKEEFQ